MHLYSNPDRRIPRFDLSRGVANLPSLPNGRSYFNPQQGDRTIDYNEITQSQPGNAKQAEVKRLLSNRVVFNLIADANKDTPGSSVMGMGGVNQGITLADMRKTAAKTGNQNRIEYKDIVALFIESLKDDIAHPGNGNGMPMPPVPPRCHCYGPTPWEPNPSAPTYPPAHPTYGYGSYDNGAHEYSSGYPSITISFE